MSSYSIKSPPRSGLPAVAHKLLTFLIALGAATVVSLAAPAQAQWGCRSFGQQGGTGCNSVIATAPPSYTGPGDVSVNGSTNNWYAWYSCARVYKASLASTSTSLCDLVDSAAPTVVICTLRGTTSGLVDLTAYCPGSVTPAVKCAAATGGVCNISQAYDQTGNSRPVINAAAASQPFLTFSAINGLPAMQCTAATCFLSSAGTVTQAQPITESAVYIQPAQNSSEMGLIGPSNIFAEISGGPNSQPNTAEINGQTSAFVTATINNWHALNGLLNGTGNNCALNVDGTDTASLNCGTNGFSASNIRLFRANGQQSAVSITEAGLLAVTSSPTDRGNIRLNQKGVYNTP
jgi:hypothetical protein